MVGDVYCVSEGGRNGGGSSTCVLRGWERGDVVVVLFWFGKEEECHVVGDSLGREGFARFSPGGPCRMDDATLYPGVILGRNVLTTSRYWESYGGETPCWMGSSES